MAGVQLYMGLGIRQVEWQVHIPPRCICTPSHHPHYDGWPPSWLLTVFKLMAMCYAFGSTESLLLLDKNCSCTVIVAVCLLMSMYMILMHAVTLGVEHCVMYCCANHVHMY